MSPRMSSPPLQTTFRTSNHLENCFTLENPPPLVVCAFRVCPRGHTLKPTATRVRVNIFQFIEQENNKMLKTGLIVSGRTPAVRALCHMCVDVVSPCPIKPHQTGMQPCVTLIGITSLPIFARCKRKRAGAASPRVEIVNRITNSFGVLTDTFEQRTTRKLHVPTRASYHPS